MGAVHFSLDIRLVEYLKQALPLSIFVETGTFEGASVEACLPYFEKIYTVELSEAYHRMAVAKFEGAPQVDVRLGTSAAFLKEVAASLRDESVLYWLDAHWCVAEAVKGGDVSQCPLLEELDALETLNERSVVCIDDARLFLSPPPHPHHIEDWPSFDEVVKRLCGLSATHELLVVNDVIVFHPAASRTPVHAYARAHGVDWLKVLGRARDYEEHLPIVRREAERREAGLRELTAVIAARDGRIRGLEQTVRERLEAINTLTAVIAAREARIGDLERVAGERLDALHELTAVVTALEETARERSDALQRADTSLKEAWTEADRREAGLHELTALIGARDGRIVNLEQAARERLEALQRADRLFREQAREVERRAAELQKLATTIEARERQIRDQDRRIRDLEQAVREQVAALAHESALLQEARAEAKRRIAELEGLTSTIAAREQCIEWLFERIAALKAQVDTLEQTIVQAKEEKVAEFLSRRVKALWSR